MIPSAPNEVELKQLYPHYVKYFQQALKAAGSVAKSVDDDEPNAGTEPRTYPQFVEFWQSLDLATRAKCRENYLRGYDATFLLERENVLRAIGSSAARHS